MSSPGSLHQLTGNAGDADQSPHPPTEKATNAPPPGAPPAPPIAIYPPPDNGDRLSAKDVVELYKLEYQRAAQRYDDIYKAVWTNFSYMAVVAGAVLALGGKDSRFSIGILFFIAFIPLIFWFWATFVPMSMYSNQVERRLKEIEEFLNQEYLGAAPQPAQPRNQQLPRRGLYLFTDFVTRRRTGWLESKLAKLRTRYVVWGFSLLLHLGCVAALICGIIGCFPDQKSSTEGKVEIKLDVGEGLKQVLEKALAK